MVKTNEPGYVYILTNPSFREDWVKIGKSARPVDIRSKELDNTAVPLPFEIYATIQTVKYNDVEKHVHKTIDRLTDLRIRQNREFFNVPPQIALDIFNDIAKMIDDAVVTVYVDNKPVCHNEKESLSVMQKRTVKRGRFMLDSLKRKHIEVRLNVHSQSVFDTADGITLTYTNGSDGTPYFVEGDALLLATGRRPRTDELNLHAAGIQTDARGAIIVNEQLHTTSPHIWALGDVRGGALFDYLSIDDYRIISTQLFGDKKRRTDDRSPVPFAIFTDPPLAHVGITEEEAVKHGYSIQVSRLPAALIPRTRTLQSIDGMMKAVIDTHTGCILGCTLLCVDAPEVINMVTMAMKTGQSYSFLRDFIFTHPSVSEGLNSLFKAF